MLCFCRYQGPLLEDGALDSSVDGGAASPEFTKLCAWIVSELRLYLKLEENVHATNCKIGLMFDTVVFDRRRVASGLLFF